MKLKEAIKTIDEGWVRRRKGFRIHFEKVVDGEWITDYFPDENQKPLSSEISAWELARRFALIEHPHSMETGQGDIANVFVVDDLLNPVPFYGTNALNVFNARENE